MEKSQKNSRIRVCHLITSLGQAGAERCIFELANKMDSLCFDTFVIGLQGGLMSDKLRERGICVEIAGMRCKFDFIHLARLAEMLRRLRPDILHTHLFHADFAGRLTGAVAGVKRIVTTVHVAEMRFRPWQFMFARFAAGLCDRIVCVSKSVRDFHRRRSGLPANKYTIIPNGVDTEAYKFDQSARQQWRGRLGLTDDAVLAVFVGRLDRQKGLDVLLSAMNILAGRGCKLRLAIAGEGPQKRLLDEFLAGQIGRATTTYIGLTDDVRGLLSAADIFVMPSRWEGFGLSMAEAMAAGRPVVGTLVPGLVDIVPAQAGILVEPDNAPALADAMERLGSDAVLRGSLGRAGQTHAENNLDIRRFIRDHQNLYLNLM